MNEQAQYIKELQEQVADFFGESVEDLAGENILDTLNSIQASGGTVYWGCVEPRVSESDTFPS